MIEIKNKDECCGCTACCESCPRHSIHMEKDKEGFLYPIVDKNNCIDCGLCEKSCPIINFPFGSTNQNNKAWIGYAKKDELRLASSSGGVFSLLASMVFEQNGVIFGASFDNEFTVHHIMIDSSKDLELLRGSKYLQSRIEDSYILAKEKLDQGKLVIFSGVACQIAGLKTFLKKEYSNLLTVDVLCHGVPSPELWKKYLSEKESEYGGAIQNVHFRDKISGWKKYSVRFAFSNKTEYVKTFKDDYYMKLFLKNICLRPSCHNCNFKDINRPSDITLGDAWGIDKYCPEMDDDKGASVIITHSEKGEKMLTLIQNELVLQERSLDEVLPASADSRKSVPEHPKRNRFFSMLSEGESIETMIRLTNPSIITRMINKIKRVGKGITKNN